MSNIFTLVTRKKSKARIAVMGPSGSGKTLSSLYLAKGITGNWGKVALIDTEHERGRFYADFTISARENFSMPRLHRRIRPKST